MRPRPRSCPQTLAEIAQQDRSRIEQFRKQISLARLPMITERKRCTASHCKAEPARQCDGRRKTSPLRNTLKKPAPWREWDHLTVYRFSVGQYCTGARDDPLKTAERPFGAGKRMGSPDVCRRFRICCEQG